MSGAEGARRRRRTKNGGCLSYERRRVLPVYGSNNPRRATLHTGFVNGKTRGAEGARRRARDCGDDDAVRGSDNGRRREARQGKRSSLRRAAAGDGAKRDEVCSPATCNWAAQWHLARAVGKRFRGCRAQEKNTKAAGRRRQGGRRPRRAAAAGRPQAASGRGRRPPTQGGRRCRAGPQAAAAGRPRLQGGRRRPQATRVSTIACLLPRGEAEEARRDLGGN